MSIKKTLLVLGAVSGVGLASVAGLGVAAAATNSHDKGSLVERVASKFNLDKGEVGAVFEEHRAERQAEHHQSLEDRLNRAVKDGKLTEEQKTKILAKLEELKAARQEWRENPSQEHSKDIRELHSSLKKWAKENNVPVHYLNFMIAPVHHDSGPQAATTPIHLNHLEGVNEAAN